MPRKTKIQIWQSTDKTYIILIGRKICLRLWNTYNKIDIHENTENLTSILTNSINWKLIAEN